MLSGQSTVETMISYFRSVTFVVSTCCGLLTACSQIEGASSELALGEYQYQDDSRARCAIGARPGAAGRTDTFEFGLGFRANVRTPANYDATRQHPLLVVYAAAGQSAAASERFTGLTHAATSRGYIVAYASSRRMLIKNIKHMATLPTAIATDWCVDNERIFAVGHSDGGTTAVASAILPDIAQRPAAFIASAAGFGPDDLAELKCGDRARPAMFIQKSDDELFPDYIDHLARWFATCNACSTTAIPANNGCQTFNKCPTDAPVILCEVPGGHARWPDLNQTVLDFIAR